MPKATQQHVSIITTPYILDTHLGQHVGDGEPHTYTEGHAYVHTSIHVGGMGTFRGIAGERGADLGPFPHWATTRERCKKFISNPALCSMAAH